MTDARPTLDELGLKYNTDKASNGHDYLRIYESVLAPRRDELLTVLDLGVGVAPPFASTKMWLDYFPQAEVIGVDIQPYNMKFYGIDPNNWRAAFLQGDLGDPKFLDRIAIHEPDLVIEDASHLWSHQILSLLHLFPALRPGGIYIWEDLHTSSPDINDPAYADNWISPVEILGILAQAVAVRGMRLPVEPIGLQTDPFPEFLQLAQQIESITMLRRSAIFQKLPEARLE